jgi:hypothetical protein
MLAILMCACLEAYCRAEPFGASKQRRGDGDAEGDRLARAGLRRHQQIGVAVVSVAIFVWTGVSRL